MRNVRRLSRGIGLGLAAGLLAAGSASADGQSCLEWKREHGHWMIEATRRFLNGAPQSELDGAVFEVLQREAYMTSCEIPVQKARAELVGWRLVGRSPDEYGSAVLETVLACAGLPLELRQVFDAPPVPGTRVVANPRPIGQGSYGR